MAEAHKFSTVDKAVEVFPDIDIRTNRGSGKVSVYNSKEGVYAPVEKGQYIVSIADRYEVQDDEPEKAKPAEAPKETNKDSGGDATKVEDQDSAPKAAKGSQTVAPQEMASNPGADSE